MKLSFQLKDITAEQAKLSGFFTEADGSIKRDNEGNNEFVFKGPEAATAFLARLTKTDRFIDIHDEAALQKKMQLPMTPAERDKLLQGVKNKQMLFTGSEYAGIVFKAEKDGTRIVPPKEAGENKRTFVVNVLWDKNTQMGRSIPSNQTLLQSYTTVVFDADKDIDTQNDQVRLSYALAEQLQKDIQKEIGVAKRLEDFKQARTKGTMVQTPWGPMNPIPAASNNFGRVSYQVVLINDAGQPEFFKPPLLNPITGKPDRDANGQEIMRAGYSHFSVASGQFDLSDATSYGYKASGKKDQTAPESGVVIQKSDTVPAAQPLPQDVSLTSFLNQHPASDVFVTLASDGTMVPVVMQHNPLPRCTPEQHAFFTEIQSQFSETQMVALAEYLEIPALIRVKQDGGEIPLSGLCLDDLAHIGRNTSTHGLHTFKLNTLFDRTVLKRDIVKLNEALRTKCVNKAGEIALNEHLSLPQNEVKNLMMALQAIENGEKTYSELFSDLYYWAQYNPVPSIGIGLVTATIGLLAWSQLMRHNGIAGLQDSYRNFKSAAVRSADRNLPTLVGAKNQAGKILAKIPDRYALFRKQRLLKTKPSTLEIDFVTNALARLANRTVIEPGVDLTRATYQVLREQPLPTIPRATLRLAATRSVGAAWNALGAAGAVMLGDDVGGWLVKKTENLTGLNKDPDYVLNAFVFGLIQSGFADQGGLGGNMADLFPNTFKAFASVGARGEVQQAILHRRHQLLEATKNDTTAMYTLLGKLVWRSQDADGRINWQLFQDQVKTEFAVSGPQISALYRLIQLMTGTADGNRQTAEGRDLAQAIRANGEITARFETSPAYRLILQYRDAYQQAINNGIVRDQPYTPAQPAPSIDMQQDANPTTAPAPHQSKTKAPQAQGTPRVDVQVVQTVGAPVVVAASAPVAQANAPSRTTPVAALRAPRHGPVNRWSPLTAMPGAVARLATPLRFVRG